MFIAFEGIDGSGKTTAIKLLKEVLENKNQNVYTTTEPTKLSTGVEIRKMLKHGSNHPLFHKK
jgi:dTMP kinase